MWQLYMIMDDSSHVSYNARILRLDRYRVEPEWSKEKSMWKQMVSKQLKFEVRVKLKIS